MSANRTHRRILWVTQAGLTAALYTVLTFLSAAAGLSGGAIQLRISEALCVLPVFFPGAVPGLALGCLISNLLTGCLWQDILFGTLATLLGAVGARLLRRHPLAATVPTVLANTLILPPVLAYAYRAEEGIWFLLLTIFLGELISAGICGTLFCLFLSRNRGVLPLSDDSTENDE